MEAFSSFNGAYRNEIRIHDFFPISRNKDSSFHYNVLIITRQKSLGNADIIWLNFRYSDVLVSYYNNYNKAIQLK